MGCSTNKTASPAVFQIGGLPGAGKTLSLAVGDSEALPVRIKPKAERLRKRIDFHCSECGATRAGYPNYRHKCEPGPVGYQVDRRAICDRCEHNSSGVCGVLKSKHPDRPCLIEIGVARPDWRCPDGRWERTRWNCERCGSSVFDAGGLTRCPICFPPARRQLPAMIDLPAFVDEPAEPSRPLAVVSVAVGQKALDLSKLTWPRMRQYAEFVRADFVTITDDQIPAWPVANKFRVGRVCSRYERVLYLDSDTWVMPRAGNIFERFAAGSLWMFPDTSKAGPKWDFVKPFDQRLADESGFPLTEMRCHNSGVVLFDREHSGAWTPPDRLGTWWVSEQYWIARRAMAAGFLRDFPPDMNTQWYWPDFAAREGEASVIHLAACPHGERISRLKLYARRYGGDFV